MRLCTLPTTAPRQTSSMKALTATSVRSVQPVGRYTCGMGGGSTVLGWSEEGTAWCRSEAQVTHYMCMRTAAQHKARLTLYHIMEGKAMDSGQKQRLQRRKRRGDRALISRAGCCTCACA